MAPTKRSQWVLCALTATCLATYGATAARSLQGISSQSAGSAGSFQASPPTVALQVDFDIPLGSVYYNLPAAERKQVREALYENAMAFFPYGAPPSSFQLSSPRSALSSKGLELELSSLLAALSPGLGVMSSQTPLKYVIIDGQPMCMSSFALTSYSTPVWTTAESSSGPVSALVKVSIGIPE